jgi:hypothetical protein
MKGSKTYAERQISKNVAEFLFEYYCAEKNYQLIRMGFDEKNKSVDNFYRLNPYLRNLPDYVVNAHDKTFIVNVKGTGNFKKKEIDMIPQFLDWYESKEVKLYYAFCFQGEDPKMLLPSKVIELFNQSEDKVWPDGVVYRNLNL